MTTSNPTKDRSIHIQLGWTRIRDKHGYMGTICYEGPVETIRYRNPTSSCSKAKAKTKWYYGIAWDDPSPVSYTHLTLPTIYSV